MKTYKKTITTQAEFKMSFEGSFSSANIHFKCPITLSGLNTNGKSFDFRDCLFDEHVDFNGALLRYCIFEDSIFEKSAHFINATFEDSSNFKKVQFKGQADFSGARFKGKTRFHWAKFHDVVDFSNAKFSDLADFYRTHFFKNQVFVKTDFLKTTVFSRAQFDGNVLFTYSLISGIMIFRHAFFKAGFDISLANIDGSLNFFNIKINNYQTVPTPSDDYEYDDMVEDGKTIPIINKRETFRIIKNQFTKENNKIDTLSFHILEMAAYQEELNYKKKIGKEKYRNDRIINFWNRNSNGYGISWLTGLKFTVIAAVLSFSISIIFLGHYPYTIGTGKTCEAVAWTFKYFFELMLPTHKIDILDEYNPGFMFYIVDFIGRIFISYGIYQTISAFRKYNKK